MKTNIKKYTDLLERQKAVDSYIGDIIKHNKATFFQPHILVNPYGNCPLSAIIVFTTQHPIQVNVNMGGTKYQEEGAKCSHILGISGLHSGENLIVLDALIENDRRLKSSVILHTKFRPKKMGRFYMYKNPMTDIELFDRYHTVIDAQGNIRWGYIGLTLTNLSCRLSNGHRIVATGGYHGRWAWLYEIDWIGKIYNLYCVPNGAHHCCCELPNGNLIVCSNGLGIGEIEDTLVELKRETGEVVRTLNLREVIPRPRVTRLVEKSLIKNDFYHLNYICASKKFPRIYISCRAQHAVLCLDIKSFKLKWIFSVTQQTYMDFPAEYIISANDKDFSWFYGQHNIQVIEEAEEYVVISLFDNGAGRDSSENYSQGIAYRIDIREKKADILWRFGEKLGDSFFSWKRSSCSTYSDGRTVLASTSIDMPIGVDGLKREKASVFARMSSRQEFQHIFDHIFNPANKQVYQIQLLSEHWNFIDLTEIINNRSDVYSPAHVTIPYEVAFPQKWNDSAEMELYLEFIKISTSYLKIRGHAFIAEVNPSISHTMLLFVNHELGKCFCIGLDSDYTPWKYPSQRKLNSAAEFNAVRIPVFMLPQGKWELYISIKYEKENYMKKLDKWFRL